MTSFLARAFRMPSPLLRRRQWLLLAVMAVLAAAASGTARASDRWLTSYEDALEKAQKTGRPVLTIFTGSDWCPHCRTLEDNVLATKTFLDWADERVVLLMIDLPQQGISQAVRSERSQVCIKYGVRTFPSALLIDPAGKKLALQTGYTGQPASTWIAHFASHVPAPESVAGIPAERPAGVAADVLPSLDEAVETAKSSQRPILVLVSKSGNPQASSKVASLIKDPEFEAFARDNFVVTTVPSSGDEGQVDPQTEEHLEQLLGGVDLGQDAVELIVTDDGHTPLFSQSASQPPHRIVNGLRRFLLARQAARTTTARR